MEIFLNLNVDKFMTDNEPEELAPFRDVKISLKGVNYCINTQLKPLFNLHALRWIHLNNLVLLFATLWHSTKIAENPNQTGGIYQQTNTIIKSIKFMTDHMIIFELE